MTRQVPARAPALRGDSAPRHVPYTRTALTVLTLLTSACGHLAPTATPPVMPNPAHYSVLPTPAHTSSADNVAQRFIDTTSTPTSWWLAYESPALNALVDEGLAHSPSLEATRHALDAAQQGLHASIDNSTLPSLDANTSAGRVRAPGINSQGTSGAVTYDNYAAILKASYKIDIFGASWLSNAALGARVDVQSFQQAAARRALAMQIVISAITAAALNEQLDSTLQLIAVSEQDAEQMERRYALGALAQSDNLAARARTAALKASLPPLRSQLLSTRHTLAVLLGRTPDHAPEPLAFASLTLPRDIPLAVPSTLLAQRPDIRAASAALAATAAEVGVANAAMLPSLRIDAGWGKGGFLQPAMLSGPGALWGALASLSMPIFHGGALRAQKKAAVASYEAAGAEYRQTVLKAFQDVADALVRLDNDADTLAASEQAREAQQQRWQQSLAQVRLGAVPPSVSRAAQQQYLQSYLDSVRARAARLTDSATLFNAMGVGSENAS